MSERETCTVCEGSGMGGAGSIDCVMCDGKGWWEKEPAQTSPSDDRQALSDGWNEALRRASIAEVDLDIAKERIAELEARIAKLEKKVEGYRLSSVEQWRRKKEWQSRCSQFAADAVRYRWMKERDFCIDPAVTAINADAAIDAAMQDR